MTFLFDLHDGQVGSLGCSKSEKSVGRILDLVLVLDFVDFFLGMMVRMIVKYNNLPTVVRIRDMVVLVNKSWFSQRPQFVKEWCINDHGSYKRCGGWRPWFVVGQMIFEEGICIELVDWV